MRVMMSPETEEILWPPESASLEVQKRGLQEVILDRTG
jgi:hypothetical protein